MQDVIEAIHMLSGGPNCERWGCTYCDGEGPVIEDHEPGCPIAVLTAAIPRLEAAEALLRKIIEKSKPGPPPDQDVLYSRGDDLNFCEVEVWARRAREALGTAGPVSGEESDRDRCGPRLQQRNAGDE